VAFLGMLCVLQPDSDIFTKVSLVGLLSGVFQGASQVVFGIHAKKEQTGQSVLYLMFFCSLLSFVPYAILQETWLPGELHINKAMLIILGLGFMSLCNQLSRAVAYQHGTPSRLSTFLYFSVVLAGIFDWLIFNHIPNFLSIVGAFLVILGGALKILLRHRILKNR
jgi:drug/metabolite transporter (DMT)-like permease